MKGARITADNHVQAEKAAKTESKHPSYRVMITAAIFAVDSSNRKGASLHAIKKYVKRTCDIEENNSAPYIKQTLHKMLASNEIKKVSGPAEGLTGRFSVSVKKPTKKIAAKAEPKTATKTKSEPNKKATALKMKAPSETVFSGKAKKAMQKSLFDPDSSEAYPLEVANEDKENVAGNKAVEPAEKIAEKEVIEEKKQKDEPKTKKANAKAVATTVTCKICGKNVQEKGLARHQKAKTCHPPKE